MHYISFNDAAADKRTGLIADIREKQLRQKLEQGSYPEVEYNKEEGIIELDFSSSSED
ncbi:MAG TPA: hypothetical protein VEA59_00320 [Patescibacteria group bacterium]|nr:hypothetical protein [Patescibacteria group bacterium]